MGQRIIHIGDAPLPTPDPWADDPPGAARCPACALTEPGTDRCRRCGERLRRQVRKRKPITANLAILLVIIVGRGPMLLAIEFLYRPLDAPLLTPWTILLAAQVPLSWLLAGGLALLWRWTWFAVIALFLIDLPMQVALQVIESGNPVLPVAAILADLMVVGMLLTVYDEVRIDTAAIGMPPDHALPKTAQGAYNLGAEYSQLGQWYFAARLWQRAVALQHVEGRYRRALGTAYLRLGERAAAEREIQAARWLMPDDEQTARLIATLAEATRAEKGRS
ncbi:MAG: hypothetical protein WCI67_14080 [Chloroflexales bacterium]